MSMSRRAYARPWTGKGKRRVSAGIRGTKWRRPAPHGESWPSSAWAELPRVPPLGRHMDALGRVWLWGVRTPAHRAGLWRTPPGRGHALSCQHLAALGTEVSHGDRVLGSLRPR